MASNHSLTTGKLSGTLGKELHHGQQERTTWLIMTAKH
jgi:hypothetical protein